MRYTKNEEYELTKQYHPTAILKKFWKWYLRKQDWKIYFLVTWRYLHSWEIINEKVCKIIYEKYGDSFLSFII